jgi:SAM-dependent methyltransferase
MARHLYLPQSDFILAKYLGEYCNQKNLSNVVEIGCGPSRITNYIAQELLKCRNGIKLIGVDSDSNFIYYSKKNNTLPENVSFIHEDLTTSEFVRQAQVVFSQGGNHHFADQDLVSFQNSRAEAYFVSDEFLPEYTNKQERKIRCLVWYSTVIYNSWQKIPKFFKAKNELEITMHNILIEAEIETLLADLNQEHTKICYDDKFRNWFLSQLTQILTNKNNLPFQLNILNEIEKRLSMVSTKVISKGDHKISLEELKLRSETYGLKMEIAKTIGDLKKVGGFATVKLTKIP